jgi:hypothetical protein
MIGWMEGISTRFFIDLYYLKKVGKTKEQQNNLDIEPSSPFFAISLHLWTERS